MKHFKCSEEQYLLLTMTRNSRPLWLIAERLTETDCDLSAGSNFHRDGVEAAQYVVNQRRRFPVQFDGFEFPEHLLQDDFHLKPCDGLADALVQAHAECYEIGRAHV